MSLEHMFMQESRFAEPDEVYGLLDEINLEDSCFSGGLPVYSDGRTVWVDGSDSNSLIVAGPGSGKSRRIAVPLILSDGAAGYSMVINDPKGELVRFTSDYLKTKGYAVKTVNFREPGSDQWNPLYYGAKLFASGNEDLACEAFCEVAECLYNPVNSTDDPFWTIAASNMFVGYALLACQIVEPEQVTIPLVYSLFIDGSKQLGGTTYINEYFRHYGTPIIEQAMAGILDSPHETKASINAVFTSVISRLVINKQINEMLSGNSFEPLDFVEKKTALFIVSKDESSVYRPLVSLLIDELYIRLVNEAEKGNGALPKNVDFIFDEFSNMTKIPDFHAKVSACRSRGIRMHLFVQTLSQTEIVYGPAISRTIMACCDDWVIFHSPEIEMLKLFSERCGFYETQYTNMRRPLLAPSQLQRFSKEKGEALFLIDRLFPFISCLPDKSVYDKALGISELSHIPHGRQRKHEPFVFSFREFIERARNAEMEKMLAEAESGEGNPRIRYGQRSNLPLELIMKKMDMKIMQMEKENKKKNGHRENKITEEPMPVSEAFQ